MSDNKRIAKNTLLLFFRQLIVMVVAIYASRVILETLGVSDFGIFKLIEGFVAMFVVISGAMAGSTQRFLTIELGNGNLPEFQRILNMSITTYYILVIIIIVVGETIGLWFLNTKLEIPQDRYFAANIVYQFSLLMTVFSILGIPYNAVVIAHEKMSFYAYLSIFDVAARLLVVLLLPFASFDKLMLYAFLSFLVSVLVFFIYKFYSLRYFSISKYSFFWDKSLFKNLMSFSSWTFLGSSATMGTKQGINILLNIFSGVAVNAALGLAFSFNNAINSAVSNFTIAYRPQIIKLYAKKEIDKLNLLIFRTAKFSYYLLLIVVIPCILNTEILLKLWLKEVPQYTVIFSQLLLIPLLVDALQSPLSAVISATGKIKNYHIWQSSLFFLVLPISYLLLKMGFDVTYAIGVWVTIGIIAAIIRTIYVKYLIGFPALEYFKVVIANVTIVTFISFLGSYLIKISLQESIVNLLISSSLSVLITALSVLFLGINKTERKTLLQHALKFLYIGKKNNS